jgi:hypothetical protein
MDVINNKNIIINKKKIILNTKILIKIIKYNNIIIII